MRNEISASLASLQWHRVSLRLTCARNTFAREHPLAIFEGVFKSANTLAGREVNLDFVFHPAGYSLPDRISKDRSYSLELIFFQAETGGIEQFLANLRTHLGDWRNNFTLKAVSLIESRTVRDLEKEHGELLVGCTEICMEFLTPFPFTSKTQDKGARERRTLIDRDVFFSLLLKRIVRAFRLQPDAFSALDVWGDFRLLPYYWDYRPGSKNDHRPKSNDGDNEFINGAIGPLYIKGPIEKIYSLLLLCSEINFSSSPAKGRGYYLLKQDRPFFDHKLKNPDLLRRTFDTLVLESDIGEDLRCAINGPEQMLQELHGRLLDGSYQPAPFHGFTIAKKSGGSRLIASAEPCDHLVQKMLHGLLTETCDRMFEECSIGFRRGRSRQDAKKVVSEAFRQGFTHVLESDVAAFFDSVDWPIMQERLAALLPQGDRITLALLEKFIKADLLVDNRAVHRECGLVQGSVLAPLLANLYLDTFDEEMSALGYLMVRYGDDFLVMVRTREVGEQAKRHATIILERLKLNLKVGKTAVTSLEAGFSFLGFDFGPELDEEFIDHTALRKPVFVRSLYALVGIDSDSVIIRKNGQLMDRLPINRISEILVFGDNTISTRLLHRCSKERIPVSFCQAGGKYVGTLRPDSMSYFAIVALHSRRFFAMADFQQLKVARRIVTAKIGGYIVWLGVRFGPKAADLCRLLTARIESLADADRVESIRGYEGEAAGLVHQFLRTVITDAFFHSERRSPRAKCDPFNVLLDFASSLVFSRLNVLLRSQGLNPYLGFLHSHKDDYESLVCDLQEPFRARTDRFIVKTVNRKIIRKEHFEFTEKTGKWGMTREGVAFFLEAFERELNVRLVGDGGTLKQLLAAQVQVVRQWVVEEDRELFFYNAMEEAKKP